MGGFGSGRWRHGRRRTVEETPFLDADEVMLRHVGELGPKQMHCTLIVGELWLGTAATLTPLGHRRWWWVCPDCGTLRKRLYKADDGWFSCRVCLGLAYERSQQNRRSNRFEDSLGVMPFCEMEKALHRMRKARQSAERRRRWRRRKREALKQAGLMKS